MGGIKMTLGNYKILLNHLNHSCIYIYMDIGKHTQTIILHQNHNI